MEPVITSRDLTKRYGKTTALSEVNLDVGRGEIFGFLGPNGAGKTTFVKALLDFIHPDAGGLTILGSSPDRLDRSSVGYLPELFSIHPFLTAREFLVFQARLAGIEKRTIADSVERSLERVKMKEAAGKRVGGFSKGMRQRIGLAQALLGEPTLLILDEPNSGLDPLGVLDMRQIILEEKERGATVFLNSHQLLEVEKTCDRVAILDRGRVTAQGSKGELTGEKGIELELAEANDEVIRYLRETDPNLHLGDRRIEMNIQDAETERLLPAGIVERGGRINYFARKTESLEDIFRRVIES